MARLAATEGLTEVQQEILSTVRGFVDKEIIPYATDLEHKDEFPEAIVDGMKEMGLFGLMIPEEYGGLGESLLTYALVVEEIARGWMSVSGVINTHFIVAYLLMQHGTDEQKQKYLPRMATGEIRAAFSLSEPELGSDVQAIKTAAKKFASSKSVMSSRHSVRTKKRLIKPSKKWITLITSVTRSRKHVRSFTRSFNKVFSDNRLGFFPSRLFFVIVK